MRVLMSPEELEILEKLAATGEDKIIVKKIARSG